MRIHVPPQSGHPDVTLRALAESDIDQWYDYLRLPEVFQHTSWNLRARDDLLPLFKEFGSDSADSARRLAVVERRTQRLIGTIGFHTVSSINRTAEIAYDLAPEYWGRGIATTLCSVVTAWSFSAYGFVRVQASVLQANNRSATVLQRCGFQYEGLLRSFRMVRGTPSDFAIYSKLAT
ncbi:GNAT family N-acetyltransferase [Ralstonia pickettii]|uniref:GNAT family N-acetyltransferase n=1 Tax=Ralstonia pickettii TaxID=329 RepID=UPI0015B7909F|nr:GNAT family protein [Ralstonia pickettii]NWK46444.1 GNAT family N-acetyltransferase [Ralstonia pickettii]